MSIEEKIRNFENDLRNLGEAEKFRFLITALKEIAKEIKNVKVQSR